MKKALIISLLTISSLAATAIYAKSTPFSTIDAAGNLNISIVNAKHSHYTHNKQVTAHISNGTLFLRSHSKKPAHITVYTNSHNALALFAKTNGNITLNGMTIKLNEISAKGSSKINLKWATGDNIAIFATGNSRITLAGNVGTVRAKLSGHSFLNAKYLRAQHTWLKTNNFAQAEVISSNSIQAYPSDSSNIYYYKTPKLLNPMNSQAGNTLQLGWEN